MSEINVVPLGAGQDVGRSCILLRIGGKNVMLDCGMHMGFNDERRFPDFSYINKNGSLTDFLDCVIISHFHLDHCGALPYMSEIVGYDGPIYMTNPTKAICPILLEDYRKITVERKGEQNFFTSEMIKLCMKKVVGVNLNQVIKVDNELTIKAYYAGHVLGAAMFHVQVGNQSVVYTGDYNMTPDRHLGAALIDKCRPDVLITESTYATTVRDSKRSREREFLKKVHNTVEKGGKVLIPVFALGRAQELCILLETYWDQKNLKVPIYFSLGLTDKATNFYKLFIAWTNEKIKNTFVQRNMFEFKHISPFDRKLIDHPEPMVVFATPGMLHGGLSLHIFRKWCTDELNTIIVPGYCVSGTAGWKILNGQRKLEFENRQTVDVKMSVQYLSFSAHADAKGIIQLIKQCCPKNIILVHGEASKMEFFIKNVHSEFGIPCYMPANGECVKIPTTSNIPIDVSVDLLKKTFHNHDVQHVATKSKMISGALVLKDEEMRLMEASEVLRDYGLVEHDIKFTSSLSVNPDKATNDMMNSVFKLLQENFADLPLSIGEDESMNLSDSVVIKLSRDSKKPAPELLLSWNLQDEVLGSHLWKLLNSAFGK